MSNPYGGTGIAVHSPARETVHIIPDKVIIENSANAVRSVLRNSHAKFAILYALWLNGTIHHETGFATKLMYDLAKEHGYTADITAISSLLKGLDKDGFIYRELKGRRCYTIQLQYLPETWYHRFPLPEEKIEENNEEWDPGLHNPITGEPLYSDAAASIEEETTYDVMAQAADKVAASLLEQCLTILQTQNTVVLDDEVRRYVNDINQLQVRLNAQIEDSQCLRRKLAEVSDELTAVKFERDGLRSKVRTLENNVKVALSKENGAYIDSQVRKAIDQTMRERPINGSSQRG